MRRQSFGIGYLTTNTNYNYFSLGGMVVGYCGVGGAGAAVGEGEGGSNREVKVLNSELDTRAQFFSVQIHFFSENPKILKACLIPSKHMEKSLQPIAWLSCIERKSD